LLQPARPGRSRRPRLRPCRSPDGVGPRRPRAAVERRRLRLWAFGVHGGDQRRPGGAGRGGVTRPHRAVRARSGHHARHRPHRGAPPRTPPAGEPATGPTIEFARSNLAVPWSSDYGSVLELAEACDVPVRWSCRTGVCHTCETTVIAGALEYRPDPVEPPAEG